MTRPLRLATSAAIAAFAVLAILLARQIPSRHVRGDPGPGAFPLAASVIVLAGAALALIADARRPARGGEPWGDALVVSATTVAYIALMPVVGFVISTTLYLVATSVHLDKARRNPRLTHLLVAVVTAVGLWLIFSRLLDVVFPGGVFGV